MERVLVWNALLLLVHTAINDDEAYELAEKGNKVIVLECDESIGGCAYFNPEFDKSKCKLCRLLYKPIKSKYTHQNIKRIKISDYIKTVDESLCPNFSEIDSVEELLNIYFHGVDIGQATLSFLIDLSRNPKPVFSPNIKKYVKTILEKQVYIILALEQIIEKEKIDRIVFCNGRIPPFKSALGVATEKKVNFTVTEVIPTSKCVYKDYYYNTIPHSAMARKNQIEKIWNEANLTEQQKFEIGKLFFENRKHSKPAGDKVYTKNQQDGLLPEGWNASKTNIVIFNSSEDEFAAIGGDYNKYKIYNSQIEGIRKIVSHYKNDNTKHFYLRIHPNLANLPYPYHTELYKILSPNLTIIPPTSTISTYALIDSCDKIMVFNSTIGIEGAYWGKPVISMRYSLYYYLNCTYIPLTEEELWDLIDDDNLSPLYSDYIIKYGFYFLTTNRATTKYTDLKIYKDTLLNKQFTNYGYATLLGSRILFSLTQRILYKLTNYFCNSKFPNIKKELQDISIKS